MIRTRFAPSPTGHVHIGNIRAAIYNWLYARNMGGKFLLRVEDTDRARSTPEAIRTLLDVMTWLSLEPDEEPLYQSSRAEAHLKTAEELLSKGLAYKEDKGGTGQGEAVVFKMPGKDFSFTDAVKGELYKKAEDMKDFVIVRSNGTPVFHLANVLDDIEMGVTHVIRGDDHVENTFRHIALYEAVGASVPTFAHLPMIVNAQGKPYSKRDGDAYVGDFKDRGFLPEALFNYLTLLGWSPGDDREVMSRDEIVSAFSLERVQSSAAQMDIQKLSWMNGEHIRKLPQAEMIAGCRAEWDQQHGSVEIDSGYFEDVVALMGERIKFFGDIVNDAAYFFLDEYSYDEKATRKRLLKEGAMDLLSALGEKFGQLENFDAASTEAALRELSEKKEVGAGQLIHPVRMAVSGTPAGPGLFEMLELLGKDRVLSRIGKTVEKFSNT